MEIRQNFEKKQHRIKRSPHTRKIVVVENNKARRAFQVMIVCHRST